MALKPGRIVVCKGTLPGYGTALLWFGVTGARWRIQRIGKRLEVGQNERMTHEPSL